MRKIIIATGLALLLGTLLTATADASRWNGILKLGGIYLDEAENSDLSAVQETYNIYDGFNVTKILLNGQFATKHFEQFEGVTGPTPPVTKVAQLPCGLWPPPGRPFT